MIYYVDEFGGRHSSLPRMWNNTTPVDFAILRGMGWTMVDEPVPEPVPQAVHYSKRSVIKKFKSLGLWERVKAMIIEAGLEDEFVNSIDLATDDEDFMRMRAMIESQLPEGMTADDFLTGCELEIRA